LQHNSGFEVEYARADNQRLLSLLDFQFDDIKAFAEGL